MSKDKPIYKVIFVNQDKVYEVFCHQIYQSDLYGFVEIEQLIFGERSQLLVDPGEEKLKSEFTGVERSYIPMHAIIRIDEVDREGVAKIKDNPTGNIRAFPSPVTPSPKSGE